MYWAGMVALIAVAAVCYLPSMRGGFLWDDDVYVTHNKALSRAGGIQRIWLGVRDPKTYPVPQYYPMTHTSFWLETRWQDWSKPLSSMPFHLINVMLHAMNAWLLWVLLRRLGVPGAFVIAGIWMIHPLQVESVAWITERKNVLSGFFFFASMIVYVRFCSLDLSENPRGRWELYVLALVLFVCSILSKSVTGSMPVMVLLLIWWKRGTIGWKEIKLLLPFVALAMGMGAITSMFERDVVGAQGADWNFSDFERIRIAGGSLWFYLGKLFLPVKLSFIYEQWNLRWPILYIAPVAAVVVLAALFALRKKIGRGPIVAALMYAITLFPALGFVNIFPMRYSFVADHFQYLAGIPIIASVVWCVQRVIRSRAILTVVAVIAAAGLATATFQRNHVYTDAITLWTDTLEKNPTCWMAENNLGAQLLSRNDLAEAEVHFKRALQLRPKHVEAEMQLGMIAVYRGDPDAGLELLNTAAEWARADPNHPHLAAVYYNLGYAYQKKGDKRSAFAAYRNAAELDPNDAGAFNAAGALLLEEGDPEHAKMWLEKAIEIDPSFLKAHTNMGNLLLQEGDPQAAMQQWLYVLSRDPSDAFAMDGIGRMMAQMRHWDESIFWFEKAVMADPNFELARVHLANAQRERQKASTRPAATSRVR